MTQEYVQPASTSHMDEIMLLAVVGSDTAGVCKLARVGYTNNEIRMINDIRAAISPQIQKAIGGKT